MPIAFAQHNQMFFILNMQMYFFSNYNEYLLLEVIYG